MPILHRLGNPSLPDDDPNAESRLSPLVPGRSGRPSFSLEALRERVERQFHEETAGRADILAELDTEASQRTALREIAEYVFAVEAVSPTAADRQAILDRAHSNLFGFGPLEDLLRDETVTEISIIGPAEVSFRREGEPPRPALHRFDDGAHLAATVARLLAGSGAALSESIPFVETGVTLRGRRTRLSAIGPPLSSTLTVTLRLHPPRPLALADLEARGALPPAGIALLRAVAAAGHGLLIAGDAGAGKTTLAGALLPELAGRIAAAERAGELPLPPEGSRFSPALPAPDQPGADFAESIRAALTAAPDWLVIDEIGAGEAPALWEVLAADPAPRCLWTLRAPAQPDRLRSALTMLLRRAQPAVDATRLHHTIAARLPFVAVLARAGESQRLALLAEWQAQGSDLALRPLLAAEGDGWALARDGSAHLLDLPPGFWG